MSTKASKLTSSQLEQQPCRDHQSGDQDRLQRHCSHHGRQVNSWIDLIDLSNSFLKYIFSSSITPIGTSNLKPIPLTVLWTQSRSSWAGWAIEWSKIISNDESDNTGTKILLLQVQLKKWESSVLILFLASSWSWDSLSQFWLMWEVVILSWRCATV